MASNTWDEDTPSGTSEVRQLDDEWNSFKTNLGGGLDDEHEWDTTEGVANRGTHRQGSARAFLDIESNLSVSGTSFIGRLYVASDTSRFFCIPDSGQTIFLGDATQATSAHTITSGSTSTAVSGSNPEQFTES